MATLVSSYPSLDTARGLHTTDRGFAAGLVTALTLFALAIHGYHPYAEDGGLYLAGAKRLLDPTLYPGSTEFVLAPTRFSLFAPMVAAIARAAAPIAGLPAVLLALHLATTWLTLFAAWMLAERCHATRGARAGAVVLLACWLSLPVAGTALMMMDPYLTARSLCTPCLVLALGGVLDATGGAGAMRRRQGMALWAGAILVAAALHPLMAGYAFGASLLLLCVRSRFRGVRIWGPAALCIAALALAAALNYMAPQESADYTRIAITRQYWFLMNWQWYELAGLWAPAAILIAFLWRSRKRPSQTADLALAAVVAGLCGTLIALLFARTAAATHLVARLQPLRIFQVVYVVMILALGAALGEWLLRRVAWRWAVAVALLSAPMLLASRATYPASAHMEMPWSVPASLWQQAFLWISQNTPRDALFALDSDYIALPGEDAQCFRAIAERSSLPDYSKDGGEASIAPDLTGAWVAGQAAQANLSGATDAQRIASVKPHGVSWVVLRGSAATSFVCPYRNAAVQVCQIP